MDKQVASWVGALSPQPASLSPWLAMPAGAITGVHSTSIGAATPSIAVQATPVMPPTQETATGMAAVATEGETGDIEGATGRAGVPSPAWESPLGPPPSLPSALDCDTWPPLSPVPAAKGSTKSRNIATSPRDSVNDGGRGNDDDGRRSCGSDGGRGGGGRGGGGGRTAMGSVLNDAARPPPVVPRPTVMPSAPRADAALPCGCPCVCGARSRSVAVTTGSLTVMAATAAAKAAAAAVPADGWWSPCKGGVHPGSASGGLLGDGCRRGRRNSSGIHSGPRKGVQGGVTAAVKDAARTADRLDGRSGGDGGGSRGGGVSGALVGESRPNSTATPSCLTVATTRRGCAPPGHNATPRRRNRGHCHHSPPGACARVAAAVAALPPAGRGQVAAGVGAAAAHR